MAQAKSGDTVKVHYTGRLDDGTVFDSSAARDPLELTIGGDRLIPGFEQAVVGMNLGESKTVEIPADEAFGPYREELVTEVERSKLPMDIVPEVGQKLNMTDVGGQTTVVTVAEVSESSITIDTNHPLAGKDLTFDIELVQIV
ncbi:MAG: FKBP-type peptidyl-prolyl cis-trans isomerase [Planctomycetota bacterium]|jgi:FKBP-type peptidyl-prolyl cis-trans isomerase 2